jgi:hypothetical protein
MYPFQQVRGSWFVLFCPSGTAPNGHHGTGQYGSMYGVPTIIPAQPCLIHASGREGDVPVNLFQVAHKLFDWLKISG